MKRLLILLLVVASTLLALPNNIKAETIHDQKIDVIITKDGNKVYIEHTSGISIDYAVVEYGFIENGQFISMLDTFKVNDNMFEINKGVNTTAVKVHQIKTLRNNIYYTYSTSNQNTVGSFSGVTRMNIVEIETTHVKTVNAGILSSAKVGSPSHKYYEFYFQFDKEHDELKSIDVSYIIQEYKWWGLVKGEKYNVEDNISINSNVVMSGWEVVKLPGVNVTPNFLPKNVSVKALESNKTEHPGNYVARVSAKTNWLKDSFKIENFAILKIAYTINGEFIIDDVINDPSTPIDDQIDGLLQMLENIQKGITSVTNFFNGIINLLTENGSTVLKVIIVIIALVLIGPIFFILKGLFTIIKIIFKIPKMIFNSLKLLFIPKKKEKYRYDERGRIL